MRRLFVVLLVMVSLTASAQMQFGYLSYQTVIQEMPEYAKVQQDLAALRAKYEAEATRGEEEFQKKFVEFLRGQKDFPQSIMQKRQAELQTLMDGGIAFRKQTQELLKQAEEEALAGVRKRLNQALLEVGTEFGYGFILNIDNNTLPFVNPLSGIDVTELVRRKLGLIPDAPAEGAPAAAPAEGAAVAPAAPAT